MPSISSRTIILCVETDRILFASEENSDRRSGGTPDPTQAS